MVSRWSATARDIMERLSRSPLSYLPLAALILLVALAFGFSATIMLPPQTSLHSDIGQLHFNSGVPANTHPNKCGTYRSTARVGHIVGATIQLAAGFCWNGNRVRWIWGLHRDDCRPAAIYFAVVKMTCSITGGHRGNYMNVLYEAHVS